MERPKTLREKYERELSTLYSTVDAAQTALHALTVGGVQSYSLGNRSCTNADTGKLLDYIKYAENRIDELEALLSGRAVRHVQTHSYLSPTMCLPKKG